MEGLYVERLLGIVPQSLTQGTDCLGQRSVGDERVLPDRVDEVLARDDLTRPCEEIGEHAEHPRRQRDLAVGAAQEAVGRVERERTECDHRWLNFKRKFKSSSPYFHAAFMTQVPGRPETTRMSLFATKSIEQIEREQLGTGTRALKRVLGPAQLVMLGVGAVIGTGIFVLTGQAAAANAGPAIVISMVIAGLVSALAGLCYSEFASSVPVAGSAYIYAYATLGEFIAWIIGWDLILEYALGAATVAVGWSGNFVTLLNQLGLTFPPALSAAPGVPVVLADGSTVTAVFNLPAVLITIAVTALLVVGVSESATVNAVVVVIKVAVVLIVIAAGAFFINPENWTPFIPPNTGRFGEYGISGILRGAAVIFFAYIGFDAVSTSAQEATNPQRDMPRGILGSLAVCTILYILISAVMVGLVPYKRMLGEAAPFVVAIDAAVQQAAGTPWHTPMTITKVLITVGVLAGLSSVMVVMMLAQPRIFLAMGNDGLLPAWTRRIHPRFRTPHVSTLVTGAVVAVAAGFTGIATLGNLVSIGTLMAFVIVSIGIIVLRTTRPDLPRPFRTPLSPYIPAASAIVSFGLMLSLPWATWERLILWMVIGVVFYFAYGYRKSKIRSEIVASPS
jgi:basic amino acid/polyamine antiporter, APA family